MAPESDNIINQIQTILYHASDKVMSIPILYLVDDDNVSHLINQKIINHYIQLHLPVRARLLSFSSAQSALDYLRDAISGEQWTELPEFIFLDISMPILSGWEFLDRLQLLLDRIDSQLWQGKLRLYLLTSSNSLLDKKRAIQYPLVKGYLEKPLTEKMLSDLMLL